MPMNFAVKVVGQYFFIMFACEFCCNSGRSIFFSLLIAVKFAVLAVGHYIFIIDTCELCCSSGRSIYFHD